MSKWNNEDNDASVPTFVVDSVTPNTAALYGNTTSTGVFLLDAAEIGTANTVGAHAGWVVRKVGTGGRAGRVTIETVVTMKKFPSDNASHDTVFPNPTVSISVQPANTAVTAPDPATFTVTAASSNARMVPLYQWQANTGSGFVNILSTNTNWTGATTNTLVIRDTTGVVNSSVRVLVFGNYANTVTSSNATLTVS